MQPGISDYALPGDTQTSAPVSREGSIDLRTCSAWTHPPALPPYPAQPAWLLAPTGGASGLLET
jgi:hypothetical protein